MRPRRTHESTTVYALPGGNEDNDLWVCQATDAHGNPVLSSVWVPTEEERAAIVAGHNVELLIWGTQQPPVAVVTTDVELGKAPK